MAVVTLGPVVSNGLRVYVVSGHPFTSDVAVRLSDGSPWPNAPVLTFDGGVKWSATLSADGVEATWLEPADQVESVVSGGRGVDLSDPVTGRVWASGFVVVQSVPSQGGSGVYSSDPAVIGITSMVPRGIAGVDEDSATNSLVFRFTDSTSSSVPLPAGTGSGTGPMGPQGPAGPAGPVGPQGPVGPVGSKGDTGATGVQGATGPAGKDGATGPQGPAGADGAVGPQGPQGVKGDTGAQGPAGADSTVPGPAGPQGPKGDTGDTGATGAQGPQGVAGATGATGAQGATGPAGPGVPTGGTAGQILAKNSATNYDTAWIAAPSGGSSDPWTYVVCTTAITATGGSVVYDSTFQIPTTLAAGLYEWEARILNGSNATAAGIAIGHDTLAGVGKAYTSAIVMPTSSGGALGAAGTPNSNPVQAAATSSPGPSLPQVALAQGVFRIDTGNTGSPVKVGVYTASGTGSSLIQPDSFIRYRKIA